MSDSDTITAGKVVTIHYTLTLDDGQKVDSSRGGDPLAYLHGAENIVPGLEKQLDGKTVGDEFEAVVKPDEAYGERIPDAVQQVQRSAFPADATLEVGMQFQAEDEAGNRVMGTITSMDGEAVTVDFNHPLAGRTLNFAVEVTAIRDASDEEQQHGHPHGPGGHQH